MMSNLSDTLLHRSVQLYQQEIEKQKLNALLLFDEADTQTRGSLKDKLLLKSGAWLINLGNSLVGQVKQSYCEPEMAN